MVGEKLQLSTMDSICLPVPLYHCFGIVMGVLAAMTHGSSVVLPCDRFDPLATLHAVQKHRCTGLYGVPTMFISMLNHPELDRFNLSTLRTGIMGMFVTIHTCADELHPLI